MSSPFLQGRPKRPKMRKFLNKKNSFESEKFLENRKILIGHRHDINGGGIETLATAIQCGDLVGVE